MRVVLLLLGLVLCTPAVAQQVPVLKQELPNRAIIESAIENFARPNFTRFARDSTALRQSVEALCAAPGPAALATSRMAFQTVVVSFGTVEFMRIGPLGVGDRIERLLFWPDPKGIALKQVQQALAAKDPTAVDPATLGRKSIAMQGLVALEYLLFGTGADDLAGPDAAYRCSYARASATLIDGLAGTIASEWTDPAERAIADALLNPRPDAADYRTELEVMNKLAATLVHGTDAVRDQRVTPIIGASPTAKPKPKSALFWRSGMTIRSLEANFSGLRQFFEAGRFTEAMGKTNGWIANGAEFEFANAGRAIGLIKNPIEQAVTVPAQMQALKYVVIITGSLDSILGENLAAAMGLSVGFSALDKD